MNNPIPAGSSIVGTVFLVIFLVFIAWQAFRGLRRGLWRQLLHTGLMICAAAVSFFTVKGIWNGFLSEFDAATFGEAISDAEAAQMPAELVDILQNISPEAAGNILAMPMSVIVMPFLFAIIFFFVNILFRIAYFIIKFFIPKSSGLVKRLIAVGVGAVEGAVIATLLLLPFSSIASLAPDDEVMEGSSAEMINAPILSFIENIGAGALVDGLSPYELGGQKVDLRGELKIVIASLVENGDALEEADYSALTEEQKAAMSALLATTYKTDYLASFSSDLLKVLAAVAENGVSTGEDGPDDESGSADLTSELLDEALLLFKSSTPQNLEGDITTVRDVYFLLSDEGVLASVKAGEDLVDSLIEKDASGKTVATKMVDILNSNSRTRFLVNSLVKISLSALSEGMSGDADAIYNELKDELTAILAISKSDYSSEQEYLDAVGAELDSALKEQGITVEEDIITELAGHIGEGFDGAGDTPEEKLNELVIRYFDEYASYLENPPAPPAQGDGNSDPAGWT